MPSKETTARRPSRAFAALACGAAPVLLLVFAASLAAAQQVSPGRLDELLRQAQRQFAEGRPPAPATTVMPQASGTPPIVRMTLEAAVKLALENNLDIAVQRANPEVAGLALRGARSAYLPTFTSTIADQRQVAPPVTILTGGDRVTTTTTTFDFAVSQNVPKGGGALGVGWANNRVNTNSIFFNFNPAYNASLTFQYTQPLVRGFTTDAAREQIIVSKVNRDISDLQLQATIANTVSNVRNAYWDVVFATRSVDVARESVDLAHRLVEDNQVQVKYGTMTPLDLTTALSQEASSRHALLQAEGNRRIAELALKRLLVNGPRDQLWQVIIEPADRPDVTDQPLDLEAAVTRALKERSDLRQANQQVIANRAAYSFLHDQVRPQADAVASYGLAGIGGTEVLRSGSIFGGPVVGTIPGGYGDVLSSLAHATYPTWTVAVNFSYPFGQSAARAAAARAAVQTRQVEAQIRQIEVQVVNEVTSAAIQVRNSFDQVGTARTARQLAEQRLDAEQKKFRAGVSTNYFVVQAQRDLADAQNAELQAEVGYEKARVEFERVQQTTLQAAGVTVISTSGLEPAAVGSARGPAF